MCGPEVLPPPALLVPDVEALGAGAAAQHEDLLGPHVLVLRLQVVLHLVANLVGALAQPHRDRRREGVRPGGDGDISSVGQSSQRIIVKHQHLPW